MISEIILIVFLSLIQGLTEFLPISSSAHLLLPNLLFGTKDLGLSFDVATHAGTLVAVIIYFKDELMRMTKSFFTMSSDYAADRSLAVLLIVATLPIIVAGLASSDIIQQRLFTLNSIAVMNIVFALLLYFAYKISPKNKDIMQLTLVAAVFIGLFQIFALIPGASRSGTAMTAGLLLGLSMKEASKFSFLLGIPTILGALVFLSIDIASTSLSINLLHLTLGFVISSIFAFLTIKYFLLFVEKIGVAPFVIYRLALGFILVII
jgi:undecaprenyl-diphosphatase